MTWRVANSLNILRDEVNDRWPKRDTASDGTKGDAAHASRKSDHNPNPAGVVRARDIDDDLRGGESDPFWLFDHIRRLGQAGFPALQNGGYVIYFGKIASEVDDWAVRDYKGPNAHKTHIHVSVSRDADLYDDVTSWMVDVVPIRDNPKPRPLPGDDDMIIWRPVPDDTPPDHDPNVGGHFLQAGDKLISLDADMLQQLANSLTSGHTDLLPIRSIETKAWAQMTKAGALTIVE